MIAPPQNMIESRRQRFITVLFPALLAPLQLLLFGPFTIFVGNQQEFSAPFWALAVDLAPPILVVAGALALIAVLLPTRLFRSCVVGLVAIGIVIWIQGNLMVADYGPLNVQELDWSSHAWRSRYELAVWIAIPALALIAARRVYVIAVFTSRVLIALQLALLAASAAYSDAEGHAKWSGAPDAIFEVSSKQNIFHFVLDSFQSDIFHDIVEADRAEMDRRFNGFTFFANHAGAFPTTIVSIPAMLTGSAYRNQEPMWRYINKEFKRASLFTALRAQDYQVDAVSWLDYDRRSATNYYRLPTPYVGYDAYVRFASWQLADLALFRHSPHLVKPAIYNGQSWRLQMKFGQSANTRTRRYLPVNGDAFLDDFTERIRVGFERPAYKFVHVGIPHWPTVLDADCRFAGVRTMTRELYTEQARCALKRIGEFLDKLRELGLYDSSLIIVSSDHGMGMPPRGFIGDRHVFDGPLSMIAGGALALLVIKPPHATGVLRVSGAPTAISDVPATIVDAMGLKNPFPGMSALKLDQQAPRERWFAIYPWHDTGWKADYFRNMDIFSINGWVLDGNTWKLEDPIYSPSIDPTERTRGFHRIERGEGGTAFRWTRPVVYLHAPGKARGMELTVRSVTPTPQTVTVEIGSEVVDRVMLSDHEWHTIRYPIPQKGVSANSNGPWVVLRTEPEWHPDHDTRSVGVMTRDLKWTQ